MCNVPVTRYVLLQATEKARNQKLSQSNRQKIKALEHLLRNRHDRELRQAQQEYQRAIVQDQVHLAHLEVKKEKEKKVEQAKYWLMTNYVLC